MLKVVNVFGGPGSGKSTLASGLYYEMTRRGYKVELATEASKDLVWDNSDLLNGSLDTQVKILAEQNWRLARLVDKVDYVVTDSPLLLNLIYCNQDESFVLAPLVTKLWEKYENINLYINRIYSYKTHGRCESSDEALKIGDMIEDLLTFDFNEDYTDVTYHYPEKIIDLCLESPDVL